MRNQDGLLFFVHLVSTDLAGHSLKPQSKAFMRLLGHVDLIVKKLEEVIEHFFHNDGRTAYLFTADHGMTDWGSHGGADDTETSTPYVAWGSGIRRPLKRPKIGEDLLQIDLCPLMASLLDVEIPSNNHGRLPLSLLNVSAVDAAALMRANALQLIELFQFQWYRRKRISIFFSEFSKVSPQNAVRRLQEADINLSVGEATLAATRFYKLALDVQEGLKYFRRYDQLTNVIFVSVTYILWMLCLVISVLPKSRTESLPLEFLEVISFLILLFGQLSLLIFQMRSPLQWFFHMMPILLLWSVFHHRQRFLSPLFSKNNLWQFVVLLLGLQLLVCTLYKRHLISLAIVLSALWQISAAKQPFNWLSLLYLVSNCLLAIFPLMSTIDGSLNLALVSIGPLVTGGILLALLATRDFRRRLSQFQLFTFVFQGLMLGLALITHHEAFQGIRVKGELSVVVQVTDWIILVVTPLVSFVVSMVSPITISILSITVSITTVYLLLSLYYETIFLLCLYIALQCWAAMETQNQVDPPFSVISIFLLQPSNDNEEKTDTGVSCQILRICLAYKILILASLFGPGNIVSISSYDPNSVFAFFTLCNFGITIPLVFVKIFLPMILTTCFFSIVSACHPLLIIITTTMIFSDWLAFHFFVFLPTGASWSEIGISAGQYVICVILSILLTCFLILSRFFLQRSFRISLN